MDMEKVLNFLGLGKKPVEPMKVDYEKFGGSRAEVLKSQQEGKEVPVHEINKSAEKSLAYKNISQELGNIQNQMGGIAFTERGTMDDVNRFRNDLIVIRKQIGMIEQDEDTSALITVADHVSKTLDNKEKGLLGDQFKQAI